MAGTELSSSRPKFTYTLTIQLYFGAIDAEVVPLLAFMQCCESH
jgi:hypothetical protein